MPASIPIYQEPGATYRADTCALLEQAVSAGTIRLEALVHGHYPGRKLPRTALPGLKTVGYWDATQPQDWGLDWHRNEGIELTLLERGRISFGVDRHACTLRADDLTFTRPWQVHRVGDPQVGASRLHWLIVDVGVRRPHQPWRWPDWLLLTRPDRDYLTRILRQNEQPVWRATPEIRHCFQRIGAAVAGDQQGSRLSLLAVLLNELFVLLLEMFRRQNVPLDARLTSSNRTVELFWADLCANRQHLAMPWSVRGMARRCGLGVTHFIHHTKRLCRLTPGQYLGQCRLEAAAHLLREQPKLSVVQVALECGFSSSQYFATLFGRHFGCTPRAYRARS